MMVVEIEAWPLRFMLVVEIVFKCQKTGRKLLGMTKGKFNQCSSQAICLPSVVFVAFFFFSPFNLNFTFYSKVVRQGKAFVQKCVFIWCWNNFKRCGGLERQRATFGITSALYVYIASVHIYVYSIYLLLWFFCLVCIPPTPK